MNHQWIVVYINRFDYSTYKYGCDNCLGEPLRDINGKVVLSKYCPHCGCKMEGENDKRRSD